MYISSNLLIKKDTIRCISIEFISIIRPYEFQCDDIKDRRRTLEKIELKNRSARIIEQSIKKKYIFHTFKICEERIDTNCTNYKNLLLSLSFKKKEGRRKSKGRRVEGRGEGKLRRGGGWVLAALWRAPGVAPRRFGAFQRRDAPLMLAPCTNTSEIPWRLSLPLLTHRYISTTYSNLAWPQSHRFEIPSRVYTCIFFTFSFFSSPIFS